MSMTQTLESVLFAPISAITLIDQFVQVRGSGGAFPPPLGAVGFQLVASLPAAGPAAPLDSPIDLAAQTNGGGVFLFSGEGTVGAGPILRIPSGRYRILVTAEEYQPATLDAGWPLDPSAPPEILLKPGPAYPFPDLTMASNRLTLIVGNLNRAGGDRAPIAGATVTITAPQNNWPFASCTTDANGGWVLIVPLGSSDAAFDARLQFVAPGSNAFDVPFHVQPGQVNSLPQTALRGWVRSTTGAPIAGAAVTVNNVAGTSISAGDGTWSFYMSLAQQDVETLVTATTRGGRNESQSVQVRNRNTVLVPAFQIATQ